MRGPEPSELFRRNVISMGLGIGLAGFAVMGGSIVAFLLATWR